MKRSLFIFVMMLLVVIKSITATTPQEYDFTFGEGSSGYYPPTVGNTDHLDYIKEIESICDYLDLWQVKDSEDPEFGGMIEDEYRTGEDRIVQTDNTQEAIYVWSRYYELTGDDSYRQNIDDAWTYCLNFPAWNEEGTSEYYRVWNCGWGLRCAIQYKTSFNDDSHDGYAIDCADYIIAHADDLPFEATPPNVGVRNAFTLSWSAWNLFFYSIYISSDDYSLSATEFAGRIKDWIELETENINKVAWALSGGVAVACVMDVLFPDDPAGAIQWSETYLSELNHYFDPEDYNPSAWILAWDSWQALAQNALWRTTNDFTHRSTSFEQSDYIRSFDTDNDGGIPPHPDKPDDEDETWVSTYIVLMGFADLTEAPDLAISMDNIDVYPGESCTTFVQIYGPGLETDIDLYILLEIAGQFLFYPNFTENVFSIPLTITLDFNLADWLGLEDRVPVLVIPQWPDGVPPSTYTWWGGMTRMGTSELIGEIVSLPWSTY